MGIILIKTRNIKQDSTMQIRLIHLAMMAVLTLPGCSLAPRQIDIPIQLPNEDQEPEENLVVEPPSDSSDFINLLLHAQYQQWSGTPYALGGMSKKGIDCSAFVYLTFRDRFGIKLPRDTFNQARTGKDIDQSDLQSGDLVFFQVDARTRHVGIYLDQRRFMHVSFKKGVTVSSMDNRYWAKRYWKSIRVPSALVAMS
jgi:hypothetical protein